MKAEKPAFTRKDLGVNPYATDLTILVKPHEKNNTYTEDNEGDKLPAHYVSESRPFTKVFTMHKHRLQVAQLNLRCKELLLWLMLELKPGQEYIWINRERYMKENNLRDTTSKETIKELVKQSFIQLTMIKDVYWINPGFMFNGSRPKAFPNNLVNDKTRKPIKPEDPTKWLKPIPNLIKNFKKSTDNTEEKAA